MHVATLGSATAHVTYVSLAYRSPDDPEGCWCDHEEGVNRAQATFARPRSPSHEPIRNSCCYGIESLIYSQSPVHFAVYCLRSRAIAGFSAYADLYVVYVYSSRSVLGMLYQRERMRERQRGRQRAASPFCQHCVNPRLPAFSTLCHHHSAIQLPSSR